MFVCTSCFSSCAIFPQWVNFDNCFHMIHLKIFECDKCNLNFFATLYTDEIWIVSLIRLSIENSDFWHYRKLINLVLLLIYVCLSVCRNMCLFGYSLISIRNVLITTNLKGMFVGPHINYRLLLRYLMK